MTTHATKDHRGWRILGRYLTGRPLSGKMLTDSTFRYPATQTIHPGHRPSRWSMLPGWKRAAWRTIPVLGGASLGISYLAAPLPTELGVAGASAVGAAWAQHKVRRAVRHAHHRRHYFRPLAAALGPLVDFGPGDPGWLTVPVHPTREGAATVVHYRNNLTASDERRTLLAHTVADKLGLTSADLAATWRTTGATPSVTFTVVQRPPAKVTLADYEDVLAAAPESAPVLGVGAGGRIVSVDLDDESPHIALSFGTGGGKSALMRTMVAQLLRNGAQVVVLDPKIISQQWCRHLPGVTYLDTPEDMHRGLLALEPELLRRYQMMRNTVIGEPDPDVGPRLVVLFEEQNTGMEWLTRYWQDNRLKTDPKQSPAIGVYHMLLAMGRQAKVNVISSAQMFTVRSTGGNPAARENYAVRALGRASAQSWKMLAPHIVPIPRRTTKAGRIHVVIGDEAIETQVLFLGDGTKRTKPEAQEWAMGGTMSVPVTFSDGVPAPANTGTTGLDLRPCPGDIGRNVDLSDAVAELVGTHPESPLTLREAVDAEIIPMGYEAARKARQRAGTAFPQAVDPDAPTPRYRPDELASWYRQYAAARV